MPTPRVPAGFKPVAAGYSIGAPDGVELTPVAGGMPRVAQNWSRGKQQVQLARVMGSDEFTVFTIWLHKTIRNGALQFLAPLDTGMGLQDHLCLMAPGSYSAVPLAGRLWWSVSFTVLAENSAYALSDADAQAILDLWEGLGGDEDMGELVERIAQFATVDTLVLQP